MSQIFESKLKEMGIVLTDRQKQQFVAFYDILLEWNQVMNLTGITEEEEVNEKHFVDSLSLVKVVNLQEVHKIIDVGTGAGFPGIPLKIIFPHLEVVLLDSLNKRVKFLDAVIETLGLTGMKAIHGRAEDFAKTMEYREQFDLCVSRAVANLSTLSEYCLPYVHTKGYFIPYKSGEIEEELEKSEKAIRLLGGYVEEVVKFTLPGSEISRSFVKIRKSNATPKKYPRKSGLPAKEPI
ncbi:MAG: 16S rRNA (guanine(527)-N(7))-methyltransferase RsmG [Lachnospiraceae bacterium]